MAAVAERSDKDRFFHSFRYAAEAEDAISRLARLRRCLEDELRVFHPLQPTLQVGSVVLQTVGRRQSEFAHEEARADLSDQFTESVAVLGPVEANSLQGRDLAHTSVITTLQKMVAKGQLKQLDPAEGKALRFEPLVSSDAVSKSMLGDLVNRVFDGSAEAVLLNLFDVSDLEAESLKRLRRAFNQKMREKQQ